MLENSDLTFAHADAPKMPNDYAELFLEQKLVPLGYDILCSTGPDRDEAIRLCLRLRERSRECCITIRADGQEHIVWAIGWTHWPIR